MRFRRIHFNRRNSFSRHLIINRRNLGRIRLRKCFLDGENASRSILNSGVGMHKEPSAVAFKKAQPMWMTFKKFWRVLDENLNAPTRRFGDPSWPLPERGLVTAHIRIAALLPAALLPIRSTAAVDQNSHAGTT